MLYIIVSVLLGFLSFNYDSLFDKPVNASFELSVNYHIDGDSAMRDMDDLPEDLFEYQLDDRQLYIFQFEFTSNPLDCLQFEGQISYLKWCTNPFLPECSYADGECDWVDIEED